MKNVTISLDEGVARWARLEAARRDTSVSKLVGEMLAEMMQRETTYESSHRAFSSVKPRALRAPGESLASREEMHDRAGLR
jgi:hypothetical protein